MKIRHIPACLILTACTAAGVDENGQPVEGGFSPEAAGGVASTIATAGTGNPAVGAAVGSLVTLVGGWFVMKRKKKAPEVPA